MNDKYQQILGLGEYQPKTQWVCYLPAIMEFGWYLLCFVKMVHGYNHSNKIVCCKPGHQPLFPTAKEFYTEWSDVPDNKKAGIIPFDNEEELKIKIKEKYQTDDITFISPSVLGWDEKLSLAQHTFVPHPKKNLHLKVDVAITPRNREIDPGRNWTQDKWQQVIDWLTANNVSVGVCGTKDTSFKLKRCKYKSYEIGDIEGDLNIIHAAKVCISSECGLAYLIYMCKKPVLFLGHYHKDFGADLHRDLNIHFENDLIWVDKPLILAEKTLSFIKGLA